MMYYAVLLFLAYAGIVIQTILGNVFSLAGMMPDLPLIITVFNAIFDGPKKGAYTGVGIGLMEDLYVGRFIGMNAAIKGIVGFISGRLTQGAFRENMWVPVLTVMINSALSIVLYFLFGRILGEQWRLNALYWRGIPEFVYTLCLVPFLYGSFFNFADRHLSRREGWDEHE
jgi:rod shape-determining protein MreD